MMVVDKHRIIKESWTYGFCDKCDHNPHKVEMVKEFLVSGDPEGKYRSDEEIWVCPRCGYTRKF